MSVHRVLDTAAGAALVAIHAFGEWRDVDQVMREAGDE